MKSPDRGFIIEALLTVEREKLTGILEVRAEGVRTRIFAYEGIPVFAEEGAVGEALGRVLVRRGLLTEEQFAFCIEQMSDALQGNEKKRFGDIVVECDFLTREQVDGALHDQVKQKIIGCIYRATGEWTFDPNREALEKVGHFQSPIRPVILEATRLFSQRRMEETLRLFEESYPVVKGNAAVVGKEFRLSKAERQFIASLDGRRSTHAILASTIPDVDPSAVLAALTLVGSVDLSPTPRAASAVVDEADDLSSSLFDDDESDAGWEEPKSSPQPGDDSKANAKLALARMMASRTARKKEPNTKDPTTEQERRIFAEESFQQGKAKLRANDPAQALAHLKRAVELRPDAQEYKLYEVWAETRSNGQRPDKKEINEIKRLAVRVLKEDAACGFGYYVLAQLALVEEKDDIALKLFQKAAAIDPTDLDAARYARFIERRTSRGAAPETPATPLELPPSVPPPPAAPPGRAPTMAMPMLARNYPAPKINESPSQKMGAQGVQLDEIVTNVLRARGPTASDPPNSLDVPRIPSIPPGSLIDDDDDLSLDPFFKGGAPRGIVAEDLPPGSSLLPPPDQKSSGGIIAVLLLLLIASATAGYSLWRARENPHPLPVAIDAGAQSPVADAEAPSALEGGIVVVPVVPPPPSAAPSAAPSAIASAAPTPSALPSATTTPTASSGEGTTGQFTVGTSAKGHRIFFDGKVLGEMGTYTVPCGTHKVKVGSGGKEQMLTIPCGSSLSIP